jgi:hypothetical protein
MKILSIDVGIKNLAFCLFEKQHDSTHFNIQKWDVVNICDPEVFTCSFLEKNIVCNKPAKFRKDDKCFCLKHSKKQEFHFPSSECKPNFITKQKIQKLYEIADKYGIVYEKPIKKPELIIRINEYIKTHFFKPIEAKNASKTDLIDIGINLKNKLNTIFCDDVSIDYVIIENQISPIANRMKTIQGMIVQYFIMSHIDVDNFEFISASNKLKDLDNKSEKTEKLGLEKTEKLEKPEKIKYNERKKLGILKCLETITNDHRFHNFVDFFNNHKKKDDLSDSFLQGLWFINNRKLE